MREIIIVEDNEVIRHTLVDIAKRIDASIKIFTTEYSSKALDYAKKNDINVFL